MYNAKDIALIAISTAQEMGVEITNNRLQKVLYYIQAEWLRLFNKPCFKNDIVVWGIGAAVPDVYFYFAFFGSDNLNKDYKIYFNHNMSNEDYFKIRKISKYFLKTSLYEFINRNLKEPHIAAANVGDKVDIGVMAKYFRKG